MDESDIKKPIWKMLVLKKKTVALNYLPAKILLSRYQLAIKDESYVAEIEKATNELFQLYLRSVDLPNARKDIKLLLNK